MGWVGRLGAVVSSSGSGACKVLEVTETECCQVSTVTLLKHALLVLQEDTLVQLVPAARAMSTGIWLPLSHCKCLQEIKKLMEEKFKTGTNKWFFSKLHF